MNIEKSIYNYLLSLKLMPTLKGFNYLKSAILLVINDGSFCSLKHTIYPWIAKTYNTTPQNVERSISNAIDTAWLNGNINVLKAEFGETVNEYRGKPTNKEFICMAADRIRQRIKVINI
ncbi:MAG TPA: sporulation initiation factor Spo0A C-terminal domain-containing protein [Clostridia bacterium]